MIKLENIEKKYGHKIVLKDVTMEIDDNESIAILGANGAGKTTLAEIICGVIKPTKGKVIFSNKNIKVGMQFQEGTWPLGTRPIDLIKFYEGRKWKQDNRVMKLVDVFELNEILYSDLTSLSGGQKQRFNCFLSILDKPDVLILDELITGLDLKMQIKLTNFFKQYKNENNLILIIVSHTPEEVEMLSDRIVILKDGKIFDSDKTHDVIKKWGSVRNRLTFFFENEATNE